MARRAEFTTFLKALLWFTLLPSRSLALSLNIPTQTPDGLMFYLTWTQGPAPDPDFINILLVGCNSTRTIITHVKTSYQAAYPDSEIYVSDLVPCQQRQLEAYNASNPKILVVKSPAFDNLPMTQTSLPKDPPASTTDPNAAHTSNRTEGKLVHRPILLKAILGGVLGGLAFCAVLLGLSFLYCRRRRVAAGQYKKAVISGKAFPIPSPFRRLRDQTLIVDPLLHNEGYRPPEGKRERLARVQQEMEEAQRLRVAFQQDLERYSSRDTSEEGAGNGLDRADLERLRMQIERLSVLVGVLQVEIQRQAGPPEYSSTGGP